MEKSNNVIKVRWQSQNGPDMVPAHGMDFNPETGENVNKWLYGTRESVFYDKNWFEYTVWLAEHRKGCLRVWVNNDIVWDWKHGWYYSKEELKQLV